MQAFTEHLRRGEPGISMSTIFIDESGYTGEDLINSTQPFFILASLCLSESDCRELRERFFKKVKSPELKHKKLLENRRQGLIIDFLKELSNTPELVKIHIVHKQYALVSKLVQYVVMPAARKDGIDLRINGRDIALTYFIYHDLPVLAGKEFVGALLKRFQKMMIAKNHQSYHLFFDPLFDERYPHVSDIEHQKIIDLYLWYIKQGHTAMGYDLIDHLEASSQSLQISHSRPLDIALQSALTLTELWRKQVTDEITIIHDASSRMAEVFPLWQTFVHPYPPPALLQYKASSTTSSIGVAETYLLNSKDWVGLQLADIVAGATSRWIKWGEEGANPADEYAMELNSIMQLFTKTAHWPQTNPTFEDFEKRGFTEEEALLQDQYFEKLAAFHRIRAYGYSYRVDFNK